jgi:ankyrin repeat protein
MKKAMAIVLIAILTVTFRMATAQKNELTKELIGWIIVENVDEVKKLIAAGGDLNEKFNWGASKNITVLHLAVLSGYSDKADVLKVLIDAGSDVNVKVEGSTTLLHLAAQHGDLKGVKTELLIAKGLDVNAIVTRMDLEGTTPLHIAAAKGNIQVAGVLI